VVKTRNPHQALFSKRKKRITREPRKGDFLCVAKNEVFFKEPLAWWWGRFLMKKGEQFKKANLPFSTNILSWGSQKKR